MRRKMGVSLWLILALLLLIFFVVVSSYAGLRHRRRINREDGGPGDLVRSIYVDGRERTFLVHVPPSYTSGQPVPLVLIFHGGGRGSGRGIARRTGFNRLADRHGFIAVYPDGYRSNWNDGRGTTDAERAGIDDISFVRQMLRDLQDRFTIDRGRIYAAGVSNGGMFVNRLGCELADRLAAIAFVVGPMPAPVALRCEPQRPLSVLGIFGTEDPLIPWRGGEVRGGDRGPILGVEETINLWVRKNGCRARGETEILPRRVEDGTVVKKTSYRGCREDRKVVLYTIEGGGHVWPPARPVSRRAGRSSQNIDASREIWEFFATQPPR